MTTHQTPGDVLCTLHRILIQLSDLKERLERGPRQIKAREAACAKLEADLNQVKADQKAAKMTVDQKQLVLKSNEAKHRDLHAKLMAAQSNREFQALKDQIAADDMARSVLEDEILESMEKLDSFKKLIADAEATLARGKDDLAKAVKAVKDAEEGLLADVARCEAELRVVEKELPPDFIQAYERLARTRGAEALAVVDNNNCGGCNQMITANMQNSLLTGKVVPCQSCGRVLYLPEDRRVGRK